MHWFMTIIVNYFMLVAPMMSVEDGQVQKQLFLGREKDNTGLYKHFMQGCPKHIETCNVKHFTWTLVDDINTSTEHGWVQVLLLVLGADVVKVRD